MLPRHAPCVFQVRQANTPPAPSAAASRSNNTITRTRDRDRRRVTRVMGGSGAPEGATGDRPARMYAARDPGGGCEGTHGGG
ncbi:MAG TPA: hypothetical protein VIJ22_12760, partial [Polyangiaceae bacterium]